MSAVRVDDVERVPSEGLDVEQEAFAVRRPGWPCGTAEWAGTVTDEMLVAAVAVHQIQPVGLPGDVCDLLPVRRPHRVDRVEARARERSEPMTVGLDDIDPVELRRALARERDQPWSSGCGPLRRTGLGSASGCD